MREILKVLVVDDHDTDRLSVRRGLRRAGFSVDIVEILDGRTAEEVMKSQAFDCVFLDYKLPDGDGLAVLQEVRNSGVKTPIVVITAFGNEQMAVEIMRAGATDYLPKKDCTPENIGRTVRRALQIRALEKEKEKALLALANSEKLRRAVINSIPDQLIVIDRNANIINLNDACDSFLHANLKVQPNVQLRGVKLEQVVQRVPKKCLAQVVSAYKGVQAVLAGRRKQFEKEMHYNSKEPERWFLLRVTPLLREQGGAVILHTDITKKKKEEAEQAK